MRWTREGATFRVLMIPHEPIKEPERIMNSLSVARQTGTTILFAHPYSLDAKGFYLDSYEDYTRQAARCRDRLGHHVEEFEIQFIDGDDGELFRALEVGQSQLEAWFDDVEPLTQDQKAALFYVAEFSGYPLADALNNLNDICLYQGTLLEAATDLFEECYANDIPENVRSYIDYDAFARDLRLGGDMTEFSFKGEVWTCTNSNEV